MNAHDDPTTARRGPSRRDRGSDARRAPTTDRGGRAGRAVRLRSLAVLAGFVLGAGACGGGDPEASVTTTLPSTTTATAATAGSAATTDADRSDATNPPVVPTGGPQPLIVDYSPTLSDVAALLYLASNPDVDLLAVTLAGTGEADCEPGVRNTMSLLALTGDDGVPVACGREQPLVGDRDWPAAWRRAANTVEGVSLPDVPAPSERLDAVDVLAAAIEASDRSVVVVALAPWTNLAELVTRHPDVIDRIDRVVAMGGAIGVDGNVETAPTAEWNLYIDPESVRVVLDAGVSVVLVPLDATNHVPGGRELPIRLEQAPGLEPGGEAVRQLFAANLEAISSPGWFLWDELAAVAAVDESVVTIEPMTIVVDGDGATLVDADGTPVRVATVADPAAFADEFVGILSGGRAPEYARLDADEAAYVDAIAELGVELDAALEQVFIDLGSLDDDAAELTVGELGDAPALAFDAIFEAMSDFTDGLTGLEPPGLFRSAHTEVLDGLAAAVAHRDDVVGVIRSGLADEPDLPAIELFDRIDAALAGAGVLEDLERVSGACAEIELDSELRGTTVRTGCADLGG